MIANLLSAFAAFFLEVVLMGIGTVPGLIGRRRRSMVESQRKRGEAEKVGGID